MDIKMNIKPETARQIACDLNNKEINFLPETESFLRNILNIVNKKCLSVRDELEEFDEINLITTNNGEK
ncbi:hypothetical protein HMPREF9727_02462 [Treponema denticola MYR-T]|uniref:Uncharacterized protein n=1 Tax=Treponema denticola H1-T TaxID=999431 RepID=M2CLY7_TREDN|nr:hypothetical protein [Treponema denticola]EMB27247.1 hypothetical protein HMPREF9727_02462 [Treponema denticola MYR-T]EMB34568.1 hypothetical protein HMPREF9725_00107 [Treponema denticola H1-T]